MLVSDSVRVVRGLETLLETRKHPETANLRQVAIFSFVVSHISCHNYLWQPSRPYISWIAIFGEAILNSSRVTTNLKIFMRFWPWTLTLTSRKSLLGCWTSMPNFVKTGHVLVVKLQRAQRTNEPSNLCDHSTWFKQSLKTYLFSGY